MFMLPLWLICGVAASIVAYSKSRNFFGWLLLGFLLGPIALLMVGFMPPLYENNPRTKKCPYCAEYIMPDAKVCKHCGRDQPIVPEETIICGDDSVYRKNSTIIMPAVVCCVFITVAIGIAFFIYNGTITGVSFKGVDSQNGNSAVKDEGVSKKWKSVESIIIGTGEDSREVRLGDSYDVVLKIAGIKITSSRMKSSEELNDTSGSITSARLVLSQDGKMTKLLLDISNPSGPFYIKSIFVSE